MSPTNREKVNRSPLFFRVPLRPHGFFLLRKSAMKLSHGMRGRISKLGLHCEHRMARLGESKFASGKERGNRRLRQLATVLRLLEAYKQSTRSLELVTSRLPRSYWRVYSEEMKRMVG